jgi:hypothetical protein
MQASPAAGEVAGQFFQFDVLCWARLSPPGGSFRIASFANDRHLNQRAGF